MTPDSETVHASTVPAAGRAIPRHAGGHARRLSTRQPTTTPRAGRGLRRRGGSQQFTLPTVSASSLRWWRPWWYGVGACRTTTGTTEKRLQVNHSHAIALRVLAVSLQRHFYHICLTWIDGDLSVYDESNVKIVQYHLLLNYEDLIFTHIEHYFQYIQITVKVTQWN